MLGVTIGWEVATLAGPVVGINLPDIKLRWLLPFVWLLAESAMAVPGVTSRTVRGATLVEASAS